MNISELKSKHELLKQMSYEPKELYRGYTDRTLYINLDTNDVKIKPVPAQMKERQRQRDNHCPGPYLRYHAVRRSGKVSRRGDLTNN